MDTKTAVIIGAGPAGLTAAYELLDRTNIKPVIIEQTHDIGGISKTVNYKGNRIDIGGHRFFSKSVRVMNWWNKFLPFQGVDFNDSILLNEQDNRNNGNGKDDVMLIRDRKSSILFERNFYSYPLTLNFDTLHKLGIFRTFRILTSYIKAKISPINNESSLEDFLKNRFGDELYKTFFKEYTEKVWGISCNEIKAEWGAQRIKGVSISAVLKQAFRNIISRDKDNDQSSVETSLIRKFSYPKYGPGHFWEIVADEISARGGVIIFDYKVTGIDASNNTAQRVTATHNKTGDEKVIDADYIFSSMPVQELIASFETDVPENVKKVASGLKYRDFITVGLLLRKIIPNSNSGNTNGSDKTITDNWIYVQEPDVRVGRIQFFNNWSPYLVHDPDTMWVGLEYFCNEGDDLWQMPDNNLSEFAIHEFAKLGFILREDIMDSVVIRMPKAYPAYFGTYDHFDEIREFTDKFDHLYMVGRNGMHRYNNMDHSMLTAMTVVDNITNGRMNKDNIWAVNTEDEYHEE
ncbi:NAD(P)/FAD-dependent oxidoreductase [candidate division KSB1 bacterium]|nr:NAD(P)/FAD-dependent oxidoreductase [candidate division KSB1 bacterium]